MLLVPIESGLHEGRDVSSSIARVQSVLNHGTLYTNVNRLGSPEVSVRTKCPSGGDADWDPRNSQFCSRRL